MSLITELIREGEHQQQDFKYQITDSRKIARTLSAFANTDGGRLLIGVKDNGRITGCRPDEEYHMVEGASDLYCEPPIPFDHKVHEFQGKLVLEIWVDPSKDRPHFVREEGEVRRAYYRREDENYPANRILVKMWRIPKEEKERNGVSLNEVEKDLLGFLRANPEVTISKFARMGGLPISRAEDIMALMIRWGIISWRIEDGRYYYFLNENFEESMDLSLNDF